MYSDEFNWKLVDDVSFPTKNFKTMLPSFGLLYSSKNLFHFTH